MNDDAITPVNPISSEPDTGIKFLLVAAQAMMADNASTQKHVADKNAETERHRVDLEGKRLEIHSRQFDTLTRHDFTLKLIGIGLLSGIVVTGFWTANMPIVTHAMTLAVGVIAGIGIAKKTAG